MLLKSSQYKTRPTKREHELTDKEKLKINEELLKSGGILRDYDNNEILYPLNLTLLDTLNRMREFAQSRL